MSLGEFQFLRPLWLLGLLPAALLLALLWRRRVAASIWQRVCEPHLLERLWLQPPGRVSRLPLMLLGLGWLLAILALAGPVWERKPEPVWQTQASRVLLLDLSTSMDAPDLAPSRLERARFKLMDILNQSLEGRVGLVVFAGEPHVVTPLTTDGETIVNLLPALRTDIVPAAGDAGAPALQLGLDLLTGAGVSRGDLLLLSDGLADPAAALSVAAELRRQGHRLSVLAVGTPEGAPVPAADGGFAGMARLDPAPLRELARTGGGAFSTLTADDLDLQRVLLPPVDFSPLGEEQEEGVEHWVERGIWLLPLLLLLAAAAFRRGWLAGLLLVCILPPPAHALDWQGLWQRSDQQAADALAAGQAEAAAARFRDPGWRGMALYQSGDYPAAAQAFAQDEGTDSVYNQGNALARAGELEAAVEAYRRVLDQVPEHADAKANLALLQGLLEKQQQQQQEQQSGSGDASRDDQSQGEKQPPSDGEQSSGQAPQQGDSEAGESAGDEPGPAEEGSDSEQESTDKGSEQGADQEEPQMDQSEVGNESPSGSSGSDQADGLSPGSVGQDDSWESVREDLARRPQPMGPATKGEDQMEGPVGESTEQPSEAELALERWLQQIPDDQGGLLRRKFMLEHLRRQQGGR